MTQQPPLRTTQWVEEEINISPMMPEFVTYRYDGCRVQYRAGRQEVDECPMSPIPPEDFAVFYHECEVKAVTGLDGKVRYWYVGWNNLTPGELVVYYAAKILDDMRSRSILR